ncbi:MAG: tyrosine type site-specific recombinase [Bacteroidetes bacterium]|jgi:site-specific recombinase XerD|nr:tyrosine type site-specific recombinase [Bacteroidota bacterium]
MAKFRFNLRDASSPGETAIHLIVRWSNNKLVFPTGLSIPPKHWETDKKKDNFQRAKRVKQFPTFPEFNTRLDNIEEKAKNAFRRYVNDKNHEPAVEVLRDLLNKDLNGKAAVQFNLFEFIEQYIEEAKIKTNQNTGRTFSRNTIKLYRNSFNHLKAYSTHKRKNVDFDTIDLDFYQDLIEYLTKTKGLATNTIGGIIKDLKTFLNEATERGINKNLSYKSKRFRVISEEADSIYLTEDELDELYHLDLKGGPRLEKVRDLFLVGCYTGLRYSDFTEITQEKIKSGFIHITTKKTDEKVVIPLHPVVTAILKKYKGHLPQAISNQKMNDYLKEIAKLTESLQAKTSQKTTKGGMTVIANYKKYELISSHTARRSFATNAYLQGVPSFVIMGVTGHKTEKAFNKYIKITSSEKAKILQLHWQGQNKLKVV